MRTPRRSGFTLLELVIVIAILGLLVAFTWPDFFSATRAEQLDDSVRRVRALLNLSRAQAMNEARVYRVRFDLDGVIRVYRQVDAIEAPDQYELFQRDWGATAVLHDDVWLEAILPLPEGPPPVYIEDRQIVFAEEEDDEARIELLLVEELDEPVDIDFAPDGSSASARWVLRDMLGRGVQMTLDGRLGRVVRDTVPRIPAEELERPELEPVEVEEILEGGQ